MKKTSALLAVLLIATMVLTACGSGATTTAAPAATKAGETTAAATASNEAYTVKYAFALSPTPAEWPLVQEAISKRAQEKINVTFEGLPLAFGAFDQQINLMLSSGEKLDLMWQQGSKLVSYVSQNRLIALDEYLPANGPDITKYLGDYIKTGQIGGKTYETPAIRNMGNGYGIVMRTDLLEKYKIDATTIKTFEDLEKVFDTIHKGEPDLFITMGQTNTMPVYDQAFNHYDALNDGLGVLMDLSSTKVVNKYEDPQYAKDLARIRTWYTNGWIPKDIATMQETSAQLTKAGKLFSWFSNIKPGYEAQSEVQSGYDMTMVEMIPNYVISSAVNGNGLSIPVTCKNPAKTVQFLNLMYGDPDTINLFDYGIKDKHYVLKDDGTATFAPGLDAKTSGYSHGLGWQFGNQPLSYVFNDKPELWKNLTDWNAKATKSAAFGFNFDSSPVKAEQTALTNVVNQYKVAIESGAIDPATELTKFNAALKSAGIDKYIAEKQKQLDAWKATQK